MSFNANKGHERGEDVNPTTLEYKIYVRSGFWRYHQNKYQIHKCDIAIIIGENSPTTVMGDHSQHYDNLCSGCSKLSSMLVGDHGVTSQMSL